MLISSFNELLMANVEQLQPNPLHKRWSFPIRISSVNVTKAAGNCGFDHIYWRNP